MPEVDFVRLSAQLAACDIASHRRGAGSVSAAWRTKDR